MKQLFALILTYGLITTLQAQDKVTFEESFDHPMAWNQVFHIPLDAGGNPFWLAYSTGEVKVENGAVQFDNASCGKAEKRVWRPLGRFLGDEWTARATFTPTQGNTSSDNRTGAIVLGFTAGTKDTHNDLAEPVSSSSGEPSDQDGIYVMLLSANSPSASIYFDLAGKDGTSISRTRDAGNTITINYGTTYYLELKRTSNTQAQFKVFTNPNYSSGQVGTTLTLTIPSTIEGLGTVQHGTVPAGGYTRKLTATLDDLTIMESSGNCLVCGDQTIATTMTMNRIKTEVAREAVQTEAALNDLQTGGEKLVQVAYVDGLGRPLESIQLNASPEGGDMVQFQEYDVFGRPSTAYLPYVAASSTGGSFQSSPGTDQASFYSTSNLPNIFPSAGLNDPYSITQFEPSPANRVVEQGAPGLDWQPETSSIGTQSGNEHTVITDYRGNVGTDQITYFPVNASVGNSYATTYDTDELSVTIIVNENGDTSRVFVDKFGRTVCSESQISTGTYARSYTIYDARGQVLFVLQPEGVANFESSSYTLSQTLVDDFCFQYKYDGRGRVIEKRVPGADWVYMVYDKLDRVVATQDGNQRVGNDWIITKYDNQGRPIITGKWLNTSSLSKSTIQSNLDGWGPQFETEVANNFTDQSGIAVQVGYSLSSSYPQLNSSNCVLYSVSYYDDYDFDRNGAADASYESDSDHFPNNEATSRTRGKVTGVRIRVLNRESDMAHWLLTSTFYDEYGRELQTQADNHLGGSEKTDYAYSFVGEMMVSRHEHTGQSGTSADPYTKSLTTWKFMTYDQAGRLMHTEQRTEDPLNTGDETSSVVLASMDYNDIGQLEKKNLHQDYDASGFWQSVDYAYNIRGWTTQINPLQTSTGQTDDFFAMSLSYGNGEYNGNIKSMSWQIDPGNSPLQQKYSFSYDGLSRLLSADYEEQYQFPGSPHNSGQFDVDLSYDLNGNIETLERSARGSATNSPTNPWETTYATFSLDNLTYDYTGGGNQLQKVSDAASTNQTNAYAQFLDGSNSGDDYDYDPNGNLIQDLNKDISSITYNHINKPTSVTYSNGNIIRYYYSADGMKLRQTVYSADQSDPPQFAIRKRSDYLGAIHYEDSDGDGTAEELEILFVQHEEGRFRPNGSDMIYEYNLTDHLGNTRITFGDSDADGDPDILQEDHYYPFGMLMTMTSSPSAAPLNDYLYNGKELQTELGLDWYDYGARMYDASIGRWNGVDALAEKYAEWSPYNYVMGNPIKLIDPDGREVWIHFEEEKRDKNGNVKKNRRGETKYRHRKVRYNNGGLYDKKGNEYTGDDSFVATIKYRLDQIGSTENGAIAINEIEGSKGKFHIIGDGLKTNDGTTFNKRGSNGGVITAGYLDRNAPTDEAALQFYNVSSITSLANELFSAYSVSIGQYDKTLMSELQSDLFSNSIVESLGLPSIALGNTSFNKEVNAFLTSENPTFSQLEELTQSFVNSGERGEFYADKADGDVLSKHAAILTFSFPLVK